MADKVQETIKIIESGNWIEILRQCKSIKERLEKLMEILPEMWLWSPIPPDNSCFISNVPIRLISEFAISIQSEEIGSTAR